jgi:hypothetical protein
MFRARARLFNTTSLWGQCFRLQPRRAPRLAAERLIQPRALVNLTASRDAFVATSPRRASRQTGGHSAGRCKVMQVDLTEQVRIIQDSVIESGGSRFLNSQFDHLRVLIRLTIEFFRYLQNADTALRDTSEVNYLGGSIFSGVDSFCLVCDAYRMEFGPFNSTLEGGFASSLLSLEEEFTSRFHDFSAETDFQRKCGLLLDLFKLQIVFAGVTYV